MKKDNTNFSSAFEKIFGHYCEHIITPQQIKTTI